MSRFCLLNETKEYVADDWNLVDDEAARQHWLDLFGEHFDQTLNAAATQYGPGAKKQIEAARKDFAAQIDGLRREPDALPGGRLNVMSLCRLRQEVLEDHRLYDPFEQIKRRENESAISLYPQVIHRAQAAEDKWLHLIRCVFAGNIFDLGSPATRELTNPSPNFAATLNELKPRPWLVDDYDALGDELHSAPPMKWAKAVVFIDNGGSDFILGVMPFVRELALGGVQIVLAANEKPSLNDVTADETAAIVERLAPVDADLAALIEAQMFEVVSTGNDLPLIDLSDVTDELNAAAADAELVVLEGMGRAVESNFEAVFTTDSLRLALLKDPLVARRIGGGLYDCVCKYVVRSGT